MLAYLASPWIIDTWRWEVRARWVVGGFEQRGDRGSIRGQGAGRVVGTSLLSATGITGDGGSSTVSDFRRSRADFAA